MIKNYFKIAWRLMKRHKMFSAINLLGLSLGVAACLLILQYVSFELSYENFQEKKDRVYRVLQDRYDGGKLSTQWSGGAYAVGNSFKAEIPDIETYVKLVPRNNVVTKKGDVPIKVEGVYFASEDFFDVFSFKVLEGNAKNALSAPNTIAISKSMAETLFGSAGVVGKDITINGRETHTITAVYNDPPANTQLRPKMMISYATYIKYNGPDNNPENAWLWDGCLTYLLLRPGSNATEVEKKFVPIVDRFTGADMKRFNAAVVYKLQPLKDIHFSPPYIGEPGPNGDGKAVYLLSGVAFFIVIIAWVNYINLATARSMERAREVGILKAIGSDRRQLIFQFLGEAALLNALAIVAAIALVALCIPGFNKLSGQSLSFTLLFRPDFWLSIGGLYVAGVFLSGLYPAFVMSGFKPIDVLKGKLTATSHGALLRRGLVVFQFAASLFLLIGTLTVYRQIQFMRQQKLGFNMEQTLVLKRPVVVTDSTIVQQKQAFKQALLQHSGIKAAAISSTVPGQPVDWNAGAIKLVGADEKTQKQYRIIAMDYDYIGLMGLKVIAGRAFDPSYGRDPDAVLYNMKAVEQLGFQKPEEAVGRKIDFWGRQYTIIGVTENFHNESLRQAYEPLIFRLIPELNGYFSVKADPKNVQETLNTVKASWDKFFPGNTFEYFFLDDHFNAQYKADQRFGQVFTVFTILAITVACLGLFGLASFTTSRRTKEIGVRKVLGASVLRILALLYREFVMVVIVSFLIAIPLAWYSTRQWLDGYAFRVEPNWTYYLIPFIAIVLIGLTSVGYQCIKAAVANPVNSLRSE